MRTTFHGITSLGLVFAAMVIAMAVMFQISSALGVAYLAICAMGSLVILYAYCAKCPCRTECGHVFPGKAAAVFRNRPSGPYTIIELTVTGLALLLLIGFPQVWLWRYSVAFIVFWILIAIAVIQVRSVVCRACNNNYCPAQR